MNFVKLQCRLAAYGAAEYTMKTTGQHYAVLNVVSGFVHQLQDETVGHNMFETTAYHHAKKYKKFDITLDLTLRSLSVT